MYTLTRIQQTISDLKHPGDFDAIPRIPIMRRERTVALLRPVPAELKGEAFADARLMAEWRNLHKTVFFTWITSTEASTHKWLIERYGPDNGDLIFMVETLNRLPFGHMALYNFRSGVPACEFGRVLRGPGVGLDGGMMLGSLAVLHWAKSELNVERFFLEVFKDNQKAISMYGRLGFTCTGTVPMKKIDTGESARWEKLTEKPGCGNAVDGYALRMETSAEELCALGRENGALRLAHAGHE